MIARKPRCVTFAYLVCEWRRIVHHTSITEAQNTTARSFVQRRAVRRANSKICAASRLCGRRHARSGFQCSHTRFQSSIFVFE